MRQDVKTQRVFISTQRLQTKLDLADVCQVPIRSSVTPLGVKREAES